MKKNFLALSVSVLALAACAHKPPAPDLKAAVIEPEPPKPVQIVEVPQALPLPGQLQPAPGMETPDKRPPPARVDAAIGEQQALHGQDQGEDQDRTGDIRDGGLDLPVQGTGCVYGDKDA